MHPVIVITGASGGLGVSTLTAVTGTVLARDRSPCIVDAAFRSGGLDATVAAEHVEGLRWGDLCEHEGGVHARGLREQLPLAGVPVLSAGGAQPTEGTVAMVVEALAEVGPVVVDVPAGAPLTPRWNALADVLVVLVGVRPRWLRDAERLAAGLGDTAARTLVVTRGSRHAGRVAERAADHLGLPLLEHLGDDPGVLRDEARGRAPRPRGATGEVARALARVVPEAAAPRDRVLGLVS